MKDFSDFLVVAHRGYSGKFPENTLLAFSQAIAVGADAIELDLQLSADGHVVVIHDEFLDRIACVKGFVFESTLTKLKSLDVGSWLSPEFADARIATLKEVCEQIAPYALLLLELKNNRHPYPELEEKTLALVKEYHLEDRVMIASFNPASVDKVKRLAPHIRTGLISKNRDEILAQAKSSTATVICASREVLDDELARRIKRQGKELLVWTVDDKVEMHKFLAMGVHAICTNYPPRLLEILTNETI